MNIVNLHLALKIQKEYPCPCCGEKARLIANIEEKKPHRNKKGDLQYYCLSCHTKFSVDSNGNTTII